MRYNACSLPHLFNIIVQYTTNQQVEPVQIWSSTQLIKIFQELGVNDKIGLTGRPPRPVGSLGTSKVYRVCGMTVLCYPLIFEVSDFYLYRDMALLIGKKVMNSLDSGVTLSLRYFLCCR